MKWFNTKIWVGFTFWFLPPLRKIRSSFQVICHAGTAIIAVHLHNFQYTNLKKKLQSTLCYSRRPSPAPSPSPPGEGEETCHKDIIIVVCLREDDKKKEEKKKSGITWSIHQSFLCGSECSWIDTSNGERWSHNQAESTEQPSRYDISFCWFVVFVTSG